MHTQAAAGFRPEERSPFVVPALTHARRFLSARKMDSDGLAYIVVQAMEEAAKHAIESAIAKVQEARPRSGEEIAHVLRTMTIPDVCPFRAVRVYTATMAPTGDEIQSRDYQPARRRVTQGVVRKALQMEGKV